jgi:hypothetical protein
MTSAGTSVHLQDASSHNSTVALATFHRHWMPGWMVTRDIRCTCSEYSHLLPDNVPETKTHEPLNGRLACVRAVPAACVCAR